MDHQKRQTHRSRKVGTFQMKLVYCCNVSSLVVFITRVMRRHVAPYAMHDLGLIHLHAGGEGVVTGKELLKRCVNVKVWMGLRACSCMMFSLFPSRCLHDRRTSTTNSDCTLSRIWHCRKPSNALETTTRKIDVNIEEMAACMLFSSWWCRAVHALAHAQAHSYSASARINCCLAKECDEEL